MSFHYPRKLKGLNRLQYQFYRALRRFGMDQSGALTVIGQSGGTAPNASFSIVRNDVIPNAALIAPCGVFLRASGFTGFNPVEPAGDTNVYDPTQHEISFIWDFGDPGYSARITPNIPTVWRNTNIAFGKSVAHVFNSHGNYTVTCWAFDSAGNWGTATHTFQSGGNSGPILDPATAFSGLNTICFSPSSNFTGAPAGATLCTTEEQVNTALDSAGYKRVLLRRGETYNFGKTGPGFVKRDTSDGVYIGAYGTGAAPIINTKRRVTANDYTFRFQQNSGHCVISDIDISSFWDPTTETGWPPTMFGVSGHTVTHLTIHRCRISKFGNIDHFQGGAPPPNGLTIGTRIFSDTSVTDWKDYGILDHGPHFAIIGCDIAQNVNALMGIDQGGNTQAPTNLGNTHGCFRGGNGVRHFYVGASSFFTRGGWSNGSDDYATSGGPPTAQQSAFRWTPGPITIRTHMMHERCTYEAPDPLLGLNQGGASSATVDRNKVFDKCLFVASSLCFRMVDGMNPGITMRNCYFYRPNVAKRSPSNVFPDIVRFQLDAGDLPSLTTTPFRFYGNTTWIPGPTSNIGTTAPIFLNTNQTTPAPVVDNSVFFAPDLTTPIGASFAPLGTTPLAGFQCRFNGLRWNFPPIGSPQMTSPQAAPNVNVVNMGWQIPVTTRREQPGSPGTLQPGTVAVGESVILEYPDYTGLAGGALGQVTQAICQGNSTQRHQVSITTIAQRMGDPVLWPDAEGTVTITFLGPQAGWPNGFIRVTNNTSGAWSSGNIWMQLDLSDYLMATLTAFGSPPNVPDGVPGVGSAARNGYVSGLRPREDFFTTVRGNERNTNGTIQGTTADLGHAEVT